jgi:predicted phage terminase large subunit-like protein
MNVMYSRPRLVSALCRKDFLSFAAKCFGHIYPGKELVRNWHHEAIAYQLMRIIEGKTTNLIINVPPRSLKSFFVSVVFPAYLLGIRPSFRIVCASYSQDLSIPLAVEFRKIVESDWYKKLFNVAPPIKNTDAEYHTAVGGTRYTTSVGGTLTGRGGDLIIIDDPLNGIEAYSKPAREKVIGWFTGTAGSRLDDKRTGAIIVVMQRLHQDDLTDFLVQQGGWDQLKLPAVAPADLDIEIGWRKAHHWKGGTALEEVREPLPVLARLKRQFGLYAFNAQYLQEPLPPTGNMLKDHWLRYVDVLPSPQSGDQIVQSWDTAMKASDANDYSVCETFRVRNKNEFYLIDVFRDRIEFPDLVRKVVELSSRFLANAILIEDRVSGTSLIQEAKRRGVQSVMGIAPSSDKLSRMMAQTPKLEAGSLILPRSAPWQADFKSEYLGFPSGQYDDQMDALSQFLEWRGKRENDIFNFDFGKDDDERAPDPDQLLYYLPWRR